MVPSGWLPEASVPFLGVNPPRPGPESPLGLWRGKVNAAQRK